jgi:outer membrane protein assembly factor BamB
MKAYVAMVSSVLLAAAGLAGAEDWAGWRGPTGQGISTARDLPVRWSAKTGENVLWKVPLPGSEGKARLDNNQSSPIVQGDRVFLTACYWPDEVSNKEFPEHIVACYSSTDGKHLWSTKVAPGPWSRASDLRGGYGIPTPAADRERVYVVFGSSVAAALTHDGKLVWRQEIVPFQFDVAMASSPVLYGDTVLLQCDGVARSSRLLALDTRTGERRWEAKRPTVDFSHSTPVLVRIEDRQQLLVAASNAVQGVDPSNGEVLWWCQTAGDTASPVWGGGLVYCDGGRGGPGAAVEPGGKGDLTKTRRKWTLDRVPAGFSSPVIVGEHLYRLCDPGVLKCWKLATGEEVFSQRLNGVSTASSPFVTADGRIYLASAGRSYVVKAGKEGEVLGSGDLEDGCPASAAVAQGRIYLKGKKYLWCIGRKE